MIKITVSKHKDIEFKNPKTIICWVNSVDAKPDQYDIFVSFANSKQEAKLFMQSKTDNLLKEYSKLPDTYVVKLQALVSDEDVGKPMMEVHKLAIYEDIVSQMIAYVEKNKIEGIESIEVL